MEIYLVGGAVRDQLLGIPVLERDWVVVGAQPQDLLNLGYRPVGKDFPVFLHPETKEEYALARTERKTAPGYKGFQFYAAPDVTLEEDLKRRDLTINAIAQTQAGEIIDPYNGQNDLQLRILRHVSPAFIEDPVRILRIARFASRFGDFTIAPETLELMQAMVKQGEVNALVAERVWQEWQTALSERWPQRFFVVLAQCGALPILFSELEKNPSGLRALQKAAECSATLPVRFAVLCHALPLKNIRALQRYRVPKEYLDLALMVAQYHEIFQTIVNKGAEELLQLLESLDAFRRLERLELFLSACELIDESPMASVKSQRLRKAFSLAASVDPLPIVQQGLKGADIGKAIHAQQLQKITEGLFGTDP